MQGALLRLRLCEAPGEEHGTASLASDRLLHCFEQQRSLGRPDSMGSKLSHKSREWGLPLSYEEGLSLILKVRLIGV